MAGKSIDLKFIIKYFAHLPKAAVQFLFLYIGGFLHMFGKLGVLLADVPALKEYTYCKMRPGTFCCPLCSNITLHSANDAIPLHLFTDESVSITNFDTMASKEFKLDTGRTITRVEHC